MNQATSDAVPTYPWTVRMARLANILVAPGELFDQEAQCPNALIPILVLAVGFSALLSAYSGVMVNVALSTLPPQTQAEMAPLMTEMIERNKWFGILLAPFYVAGSALLAGLLIYVVVTLSGSDKDLGDGSLHRAVSIAAYASLVILLEQLVTYVTLRASAWNDIHYFWDLKPLPGLHYLIAEPDRHRVAFAVLERFNAFTIAYGYLLAFGMRRVFGISRVGAYGTAAAVISSELAVIAFVSYLKQ